MDDQALQNLIRAASPCELPSADAVERFIDEFHRRQSLIAMQPSFFEKMEDQLATFFSHFRLPVVAYASVTAIAVFLSVLILRSPRLNNQRGMNASPLFSEHLETPLNYSSFLEERIEPVTFDLKKKIDTTNDVVSPLSFILKRKSSASVKDF
ncbi:MAG: hypothetical protein K2W97_01450 [Chthoniobacterales bacterium]|nr:hypothetical protein [Chthoniobacterales bacterium]